MSQMNTDPFSMFTFDLSPDLRIPELPELVPEPQQEDTCTKKSATKFAVPPASQKVKKASSYTKVIHELAENPQTDQFISWTRDGKFLYVRDSTQLCGELERGKYFRSSKFASIVRNLNYHCFRKLRFDELDSNLREELDREPHLEGSRHLFYHPYFQRGRPDLLQMIKSQKTDSEKKSEEKKAATQEREPAPKVVKNTQQTVAPEVYDIRVDFAQKEVTYLNIISHKDALLAEKDAEIAALHAYIESGKRKLTTTVSVSSYSSGSQQQSGSQYNSAPYNSNSSYNAAPYNSYNSNNYEENPPRKQFKKTTSVDSDFDYDCLNCFFDDLGKQSNVGNSMGGAKLSNSMDDLPALV